MTTGIYFIRHGSTDLNENGRLRGWLDPSLSALGRKQAARLSGHFSDFPVTRVLTSDLERASVTAAVIAAPHDIEVEWMPALRPINFGDLQGKPLAEVKSQLDALFMAWRADPAIKAPNGESFMDYQSRIHPLLAEITSSAKDGDCILLITHVRVCVYAAAIVMNGMIPISGDDLGMLDRIEVHPGNYLNIEKEDDDRILLHDLNPFEQIPEPESVPQADTATS